MCLQSMQEKVDEESVGRKMKEGEVFKGVGTSGRDSLEFLLSNFELSPQ